jgi:hypothetical protein
VGRGSSGKRKTALLSRFYDSKNKKGYVMESEKKEYSPDDYILRLPSGEEYKVKNSSLKYHSSDNEYTVETLEGMKIHIPIEEFKNSVYYPTSVKSIGDVSWEKKSYSTDEFLVRMINGVNYIVKAETTCFIDKSNLVTFEDAAGSRIVAKQDAIFATCVPILKNQTESSKDKINPVDSVSILGTPYKIIREKFGNEDIDGETDYTSHQIRIRTDNVNKLGDFDVLMKKQLRHEIIHAFMAESGLQANFEHYRQFGHDETTVDWFAIQFPKMLEVFKQVGAL